MKEMLLSSNKQVKVLSSENSRLKKRFERIEAKIYKKNTTKNINCSREQKRSKFLSKNGSKVKMEDYIAELNPRLNNSYNEPPSPSFKTPLSVPKEKILVINNNEYMEKLYLPAYKSRIVNRSSENIPSIKNSNPK